MFLRITEQLESCIFTAQDPCRNWPRMKPSTQTQTARVGPQNGYQLFMNQKVEPLANFTGELRHDKSAVLLLIGKKAAVSIVKEGGARAKCIGVKALVLRTDSLLARATLPQRRNNLYKVQSRGRYVC
jgi:hypothetical protein